MKKVLSFTLAAVLCAGMLSACGSSSGSTSTAASSEEVVSEAAESEASAVEADAADTSSASGSVYWLNFKPESDEVLQEVASMYTEETGVPVKVVTAASGTYSQTLTSEMDKSSAPTLFVIGNSASVDQWDDYALDLTDTAIANELNTDAYNLYDDDGKLVSIGYCYECFGIIVNPDLLETAGYSLDDITNFDTLKTAVEDIHSRADELGFDAFTSNDMDDSSSWRYTGHLANLDYYYEEQDDGGWEEAPAEIKGTYLENFKNLYDLAINNSTVEPNSLATGGHDAEAEFINGEAVFFIQGSWEYSAVSEAVPNATMIPYYGGVDGEENAGLNCGTENCWAINSTASEEDQQATMDFMVWCVTDEEASRLLVDSFGVMPYKNAAESTNAFLAAADEYTSNGNYVMDWAFNYQPNVDQYRAGLVSALNQYDADQTDDNWELVKTAFVQGWATQYAAANG